MREIWKDIKGYEGIYQVSNLGRVKSLDREYEYISSSGRKYLRMFKGQEVAQYYCLKYKEVILSYRRVTKSYLVHRLVAEAFIPNPDNLPQVNHKDEDPSNNCVDNLEWCSASYNVNYGMRNTLVSNAMRGKPKSPESIAKMRESLKGNIPWNKGRHTKPIICLDADITFDSSTSAAEWIGGVTPAAIEYAAKHIACCRGHVFVYADNMPEDPQEHMQKCLEKHRTSKAAGVPCRCIEDNLTFKFIANAAKHYGLTYNDISNRLGKSKGVTLPDGRTIHFERIPHEELNEQSFNTE